MKKLLLALTLGAGLIAANTAAAESLTMGTEGAYAPYNFIDNDGNVAGFDVDVGNELCKRAGYTCTWKTNEWDTIIPNLLAGNYDTIAAGMSITDERKKTINFTEEYYPGTASQFAAMSMKNIGTGKMSGLTIGVQGATIQAAYAEANLASNNTIKSYETGEQSVADLAAGAVDVVFADGDFLKPAIDASQGAIEFVGTPVSIGGGLGIGIRKGDTKLLNAMNKALAEAKADGTIDALLKKYFDFDPIYK